ncbi:MAG: hypothetical protein H0T15_04135 [Thermoleophilaceae bacterium]|nr:hypothetical protein [Thermoleophilaceae bacterium]
MNRTGAVALVALLTLPLAACGKDEQEEFAEQGNEICTELRARADAATKQIRAAEGEPEKLKVALTDSRGVLAETQQRFDELDAPEDQREDFDAYKVDLGQVLELYDRLPGALEAAAEDGRTRELTALQGQLTQVTKKSGIEARKLGFDSCAADS